VDQLSQYISAQERAGFSDLQIKQTLLQSGYQEPQIMQAIASLHPDSVIHDYVQQYARQGMHPVEIEKALVQQGYSKHQVVHAIRELFGPGTLPSHHALFAIAAILILVLGVFLLRDWFVPTTQPPEPSEQISGIIILAQSNPEKALDQCRITLKGTYRDQCVLSVATIPDGALIDHCSEIQDIQIRDTCYLNFLDSDFDEACRKVKLQASVDTCKQLQALR
jgi:hypothetical protein